MKYDLVCYAKESHGKLYVDYYVVKYRRRFGSVIPVSFEVINEGHSFEELAEVDLKNIGKKTLFATLESMFKTTTNFPRLTHKILVESFTEKLKDTYGEMIKDYDYSLYQTVNESNGFDFDILFFHVKKYEELLNLFRKCRVLFDEAYYFPQALHSLFKEGENNTLGIFFNYDRLEVLFFSDNYYKYKLIDINRDGPVESLDKYIQDSLMTDLNKHFINDERINKIEFVYTNLETDLLKQLPIFSGNNTLFKTLTNNYEIYPTLKVTKFIELPIEV